MTNNTPLIALFGLPNSGKSTLLNRLSSSKKAIVAREAHTTRDLNYSDVSWDNMVLQMVDTGGLVPDPKDKIQKEIQIKSWSALGKADILVWVIDRKQNPETITDKILSRVWKLGKPVIIAINKVDDPNLDKSIADYAQLGGVNFVNISASNGYGLNDLLDILVEKSLEMGFEKPASEGIIDNQKKKRNISKSQKVVKDRDGGYMIVRERTEEGRQGLYESYQTREAVNPINAICVDIEQVLLTPEGDINEDNLKVLKELKSSDKSIYFSTKLDNTTLVDLFSEARVKKLFKGGVIGDNSSTYDEMLSELLDQYHIESATTICISSNQGLIDEALKKEFWTILHTEYYPLEYIVDKIEAMEYGFIDRAPKIPKIILLGKPNVGKSSLFNALSQQELQIVTDTAGTTLSVNDTLLERPIKYTNKVTGEKKTTTKQYILLDSTGIRKPGQRTFGAESFATFRTIETAYNADVICFMVDGSRDLSHQDQVVAGIAKESKNGLVVIINKADLLDEEEKKRFLHHFHHKFNFLKVSEFVWISAKEQTNLDKIWEAIDTSLYNRTRLITRGEVRKLFNYLMKQKPPKKLRTKKRPVIYDLVYTASEPPTFELLIKDKTTVHWSYVRFLENIIRDQFGFKGTGIKLKVVEVSRKSVLT